MNTKQQARALMMRHHKMIRNRQQSMLSRMASEIGMDVSGTEYWEDIQKTPLSANAKIYDRSYASLS